MPLSMTKNGKSLRILTPSLAKSHAKELEKQKEGEDYLVYPFTPIDEEFSQNVFSFLRYNKVPPEISKKYKLWGGVGYQALSTAYDMPLTFIKYLKAGDNDRDAFYQSPKSLEKDLNKLLKNIKKNPKPIEELSLSDFNYTVEDIKEVLEDMLKRVEFALKQGVDKVAIEIDTFLL